MGMGIAEDNWGIGDSCDEVFVCVGNLEFDELVELIDLPEENCMSDLICGDGQRCTLSYGTVVDAELMDDACAALTLVDSVWCASWGP